MSNSSQKFKILLGVLIPIFVILIVLGFAFVMIGYQVGSQVDDPVINWWMVISGWVLLGTGLVGYFSLFTVVLIRRQLQKNKTETLEK